MPLPVHHSFHPPLHLPPLLQVLNKLPDLEDVYLRYLGITGKLSCSVAMPGIQTIALTGNSLNGSIPDCLVKTTTLSELYLSKNQLSGSLPTFPQKSALTVSSRQRVVPSA